MTRREIHAALRGFLKVLRETPEGDALADLLNLAWPDAPPYPLDGFGDSFDRLMPRLQSILRGWDHVARQNGQAAVAWRDAARAVRCVIAQVEAGQ